ncbi:MAG: tRNA lysidine(34) synthetase TilS [Elusimicrobiota bacterium]|jgi:tRNA(Ile)-lysidine synthase|nr:tRNA lysidine(34) synthetase TilS [Elusimicrobiota bacterium]
MIVWDTFYTYIKRGMVKPKDKIIAAVSGGADSMCLLHLFMRLKKKMDIEIKAVHFDHSLRKESAKEGKIVEKFCLKNGIPFESVRFSTKQYAVDNSISIETAGRELRYKHLLEIAKAGKFNKIATAHNANDNAETVMMKILRGGGSAAGIPLVRPADKKVTIIRPILAVDRLCIDRYVKKNKIDFCVDKSNFSLKYTRNRVRLELMPILKKINPLIVERLFALSEIQSRNDDYLDKVSQKLVNRYVRVGKNSIQIDLEGLLGYNSALSYRTIRKILPEKQNSYQTNLIMRKILFLDLSPHRLSSDWIFQIKSPKKAVFERLK